MDEVIRDFWEAYTKADELEQREYLKKYLFQHNKPEGLFLDKVTITQIKSYIDDAIACANEGGRK